MRKYGTHSSNYVLKFIAFACFITNISLAPILLEYSRIITYVIWGVVFILLLFNKPRFSVPRKAFSLFVLSFVFILLIVFFQVITGYNYIGSVHFTPLLISLFIYIIGLLTGCCINNSNDLDVLINDLGKAYIASALIVSVDIYFNYFMGVSVANAQTYLYDNKNVTAQMMFIAIMFLLCFMKPTKRIHHLLVVVLTCLFTVIVLVMQARAVLLEIALLVIYLILSRQTSKTRKVLYVSLLLITVSLLLFNNDFYDLIVRKLILLGKSSIDDISAKRITIIKSFPTLINGEYITGIGDHYFEMFYLSAILQYGVLAGGLLIIIALQPFIYTIKLKLQNRNFLLFILSLSFLINGAFECVSPFGPGTKCYFLWLIFGIIISNEKKGQYEKSIQ